MSLAVPPLADEPASQVFAQLQVRDEASRTQGKDALGEGA